MKTINSKRHRALIELLVEQRKRIGLTQADLANLLNEHQSFVARLESGQRRIDTIELINLCEFIDLDPQEVIKALKVVAE
ncbi:XRE family transcriptional regulator [Kiloniella spongiae]|uniref:XRE family transcriptional regulator n=1 Tax=Kiloniella spongiae TaxID=1489064 RepID=A0A0H2MHV5_9PROT|nr:helix-turn-helix transcriptional regulator [Kiloniella spongiae]KLN62174.1 XRE family transcriptional regulator [Kiloniella spongiae]